MATKENQFSLGSSAFWILIILVTVIGLGYLGIWSFHNKSVQGIALVVIFFAMIVAGILFSKFEIFNAGSWGANSLSFTIAFFIWVFIGGSEQSIFSISDNQLFATIASQLPPLTNFIMKAFVIPTSEEMLWMIGIPFAVIGLLNLVSNKKGMEWAGSIWVQLPIIVIISGVTFAAFHVGKLFLAFLIAAFIFRSIMIIAVIGDMNWNILPWIVIVPAFALGAHIGNNWRDYGFQKGLSLLISAPEIGWPILVLLGFIVLSAVNEVAAYFMKKEAELGGS